MGGYLIGWPSPSEWSVVPPKRRNYVEEYWTGAVRRLQVEVEVFNKLIGHAAEQGRENELALARVLEQLVPGRIGVGTGMVIDAAGGVSKQNDIILFDKGDQPSVLAQTNQMIFPVESVQAVIEVKTTLTRDDIADCSEKAAAMSALQPALGASGPLFALLAYETEVAPATLASDLRNLPAAASPNLVCVVSPGLVGGPAVARSAGQTYPLGFVGLHDRAPNGSRSAGNWVTASARGRDAVFFGTRYPVARIDGQRRVGEPGRALLLFNEALLQTFHARGVCGVPVLSNYLDGVARDVHAL